MNYTEIDGVMNDKVQWILRDIEAFSFFDKQLGREIFELFITFFDKKIIESYHVQESIVGEDGQPELKDLYSDKQIALFFEFRTALYRVQKQLEPLDAKPEKKQEMLTGSDLLSKVKELGDVSKSDLVRACGYVSTKKNGSERLNFTAFYEALLEAKGVNLGETGVAGIGKGGRKLSYVATVQGNGNLLIGKAYTALLDLKAGDEFEIKLGRKQIRLLPTE